MTGLGDLIGSLTGRLGFAARRDCGCAHRRELLNKMFPFPRRGRRASGIGKQGQA